MESRKNLKKHLNSNTAALWQKYKFLYVGLKMDSGNNTFTQWFDYFLIAVTNHFHKDRAGPVDNISDLAVYFLPIMYKNMRKVKSIGHFLQVQQLVTSYLV